MNAGYRKATQLKRKFLKFAGTISFLVAAVSWFFVEPVSIISIVTGFLVGICDNFIMFAGIQEGSGKEPAKAFAIMKKNLVKRTIFTVVAFLVAIKASLGMIVFFIAFFWIHFVSLIFVILNARGDSLSAERSEISVGRKTNS